MKRYLMLSSVIILAFFTRQAYGQKITVVGNAEFPLELLGDTVNLVIPLQSNVPILGTPVVANGKAYTARLLGTPGYNNDLSEGIKAQFIPNPLSLKLTINSKYFTKSGKYEVTVYYALNGAVNLETAPIVFNLVCPTATLDTIRKVIVSREGSCRGCDALTLRETGRAANAQYHFFGPYFDCLPDSQELIKFIPATINIKAGTMSKLPYTVDQKILAKMPIGKSEGKMLITSEALSAPVEVSFEVWVKRSKWWIVFTVFVGLLLGNLVRHLLKDKKEWEQVRYKGLELIRDMIVQINSVEDEEFKIKVQGLIDDLEQQLSKKMGGVAGDTSSSLKAKIDETAKAYKDAKDAFDKLAAEQSAALLELKNIFADPDLSQSVISLFQKPLDTLVDAQNKLKDHGNPTLAASLISQGKKEIVDSVNRYKQYAITLLDYLAAGGFYPERTNPDLKTEVTTALNPIRDSLNGINAAQTTDTIRSAVSVIVSVQKSLEKVMNDIDTALSNQTQNLQAFDYFTTAYGNWKQALANMINNSPFKDNPADWWNQQLVIDLNTAWTNALSGTPNQQQWQNLQQPIREWFTIPGQSTIPDFANNARGKFPDAIDVDMALLRSSNRWLLYSALQTILLTMLLGLSAYKFYGPSFIGGWDEIITIFWFAFAIDITVDNVLLLRDRKE